MSNKRLVGYTALILALLTFAFASYKFGWLSAGEAIFAGAWWTSVVIVWAILYRAGLSALRKRHGKEERKR